MLILVNDGDWRFQDAVALVAFEPMLEYGSVLSPLVVNAADYHSWQERHTPILRNVSAEGMELWTKQPSPSFASAWNVPTRNCARRASSLGQCLFACLYQHEAKAIE
jgi:hypothetical protein